MNDPTARYFDFVNEPLSLKQTNGISIADTESKDFIINGTTISVYWDIGVVVMYLIDQEAVQQELILSWEAEDY